MSEEKDYAYFSEALHSSYLFYTMEVDKLNRENKLLREALENIKDITHYGDGYRIFEVEDIAKQALGE